MVISAFYYLKEVIRLESGNNRYVFEINYIDKTFRYNEVSYINEIGNKVSNGLIRVSGDTTFLMSNYDLEKLPIDVKGKIDLRNLQDNKLVLKFDNQLLLNNRENLFVVINGNDTVNANVDTINYQNIINEFFIILKNSPDIYLINYYRELPVELLTNEDSIIKSEIDYNLGSRLKTKIYVNCNKYRAMEVMLNVNVDLWNYQTINDTIIRNGNKFIWYSTLFNGKRFLRLSKNKL
jgi:calcineurin-like phosphoesterase family protein